MSKRKVTRRFMLAGLVTVIASAVALPFLARARSSALNYVFSGPAADRLSGLDPPLACTAGTRAQSEGPFYTPTTPHRANLQESDSSGQPLVLEGLVLRPDCRPIAGAVVDIWHCDEHGRYDNVGFRYRGHQFTDTAGAFCFKTIRPGHYPGRTPHIHVKVQGEATRLLTTQLYFPDLQDTNAKDWIFRDDLMLHLDPISEGSRGRFNFVLAPA